MQKMRSGKEINYVVGVLSVMFVFFFKDKIGKYD